MPRVSPRGLCGHIIRLRAVVVSDAASYPGPNTAARLRLRQGLHQTDEVRFPELRAQVRVMAVGFLARGDDDMARVGNALDLRIEHAQFPRIGFVLGKIDREKPRL